MMSGLMLIFIFVSGVSCGCIIGVNSSRDVAADETLVCSCEQTSSSRVVPGTRRRPPAPSGIRGRLPLNDPWIGHSWDYRGIHLAARPYLNGLAPALPLTESSETPGPHDSILFICCPQAHYAGAIVRFVDHRLIDENY